MSVGFSASLHEVITVVLPGIESRSSSRKAVTLLAKLSCALLYNRGIEKNQYALQRNQAGQCGGNFLI